MLNNSRKLQIGVMGSAADLNYSNKLAALAEEIGFRLAKAGAVVMFGAEKDYDSLSTAAARGAKRASGMAIGITYGRGLATYEKDVDVIIATGLERGGGREMTLVLSCDAIILVSGGSGTLTEAAIAYQADIPLVAVVGSGGWADKLAGNYLDSRNRIKVVPAKDPDDAVQQAMMLGRTHYEQKT